MNKKTQVLTLLGAALLLQACDNDDTNIVTLPTPPPPAMASFDVTVTNLTNAQPLSPAAIVGHRDGYAMFAVGSAATVGLETLAEGGDNSALIAEADADTNVILTASGAAPIGPAGSETVSITLLASELPSVRLSVATMLVNTNDAFSAVNGRALAALAIGDAISMNTIAYDAGTEADTEAATQIPGPAAGGEGFNVARDDDASGVTMHAGVISQNDGFSSSDLTEQHRFDNPVMRVRIERTQ